MPLFRSIHTRAPTTTGNGSTKAQELPIFVAGGKGAQPPDCVDETSAMSRPAFALEIRSILVVDDDYALHRSIAQMFSRHDVRVLSATSERIAVELAARETPPLALVDVNLDQRDDGLSVIESLRALQSQTVIGAISARLSDELAGTCLAKGANWCLAKPFDSTRLFGTIADHGMPTPKMLRVDLPLDDVAYEYIHRVLAANNGSKSAASKVLGKPRQSLQRKLKMRPR